MNWTGGARSRASKASSGIAHKQKQFFAKVRAKMTSEAYQGSSSSPAVNPDEDDQETNDSLPRPSILKKSRKNRTPEFDIVVGKENPDQEDEEDVIDAPLRKKPKISEDQQYGADDSTLTGARRHAGKKQDRIKARLALLSEEDWLCTTVAVPLAPRSKKEQKRFESPHPLPTPARPFKHPETATSIGRPSAYLARPNAHASPTLFRASQPITEDASEYRHHPDTGVNIFKPLSQNGYVKIGKGGLPGTAADPTSQDSFLLDLDDEDEDDYHFKPATPLIPHVAPDISNSTPTDTSDEIDEADPNGPAFGIRHIPGLKNNSCTASTAHPSFGNEYGDGNHFQVGMLANLPNLPLPLAHSSSSERFTSIIRQIDKVAEDTPIMTPHTFLQDRHTPSSPTSYVTHFVSRTIASSTPETDRQEPASEIGEETDGYELPKAMEIDQSVIVHASSSSGFISSEGDPGSRSDFQGNLAHDDQEKEWRDFLCSSSSEDEFIEGVGGDWELPMAKRRCGEPVHETTVATDHERSGAEEYAGKSNTNKAQENSAQAGDNTFQDNTLQPPLEQKDRDTEWKEFVTAGLKALPAVGLDEELGRPEFEISGESPPFVKLDDDENAAWRDFVFKDSALSDSDDEDLYIPKPEARPDGRSFTALTATQAASTPRMRDSSPISPMVPYLSSNEDSLVGNVSSSPGKSVAAESVMANPSSSSGVSGVSSPKSFWKKL